MVFMCVCTIKLSVGGIANENQVTVVSLVTCLCSRNDCSRNDNTSPSKVIFMDRVTTYKPGTFIRLKTPCYFD